jgi:hypothetical protein
MYRKWEIFMPFADTKNAKPVSEVLRFVLLISASGVHFPRAQRKPQPSRRLLRLTFCVVPAGV